LWKGKGGNVFYNGNLMVEGGGTRKAAKQEGKEVSNTVI